MRGTKGEMRGKWRGEHNQLLFFLEMEEGVRGGEGGEEGRGRGREGGGKESERESESERKGEEGRGEHN